MDKTYKVNEMYYSLQGEGVRAGIAHVFIRFHGCNLDCTETNAGFDCDTKNDAYKEMSAMEISKKALSIVGGGCDWILVTGGEPSLQIDGQLIHTLHASGFRLAIESNGTRPLPPGFEWITVSPKKHGAVLQGYADELKYVIRAGDPLPLVACRTKNFLLSPAYEGKKVSRKNLEYCVKLCLENPKWRLSVQQHKYWKIR
jgi:organic radical activating enzyme